MLGCGCPQWLWHFRRLWRFQRRASSASVSSLDLDGYTAIATRSMAVFSGWSWTSSSSVSSVAAFLVVAGFSTVVASSAGAGSSVVACSVVSYYT
jgi:hypothetical protein